ncbi:MAG: glycosyltransferase family 4 protein, partial [Bacteroidota bacterium]
MKILHVSSAITWRGGEQQIAYLMDEVEVLGHQQFLLCPTNSALSNYAKEKGFSIIEFVKRSSINFSAAKDLKKTATEHQIDLIHMHDSHAHTIGVLAASLFGLNCPLVLNRRVDFPIKKNIFSRWKYNHTSIKKILCVSENIANVIKHDINDINKIKVVHSGIDASKFKFSNSNILRQEYQISPKTILIGNVASVADHKDYFTFVDTAEILIKEDLEFKFFIIGNDGGQFEEIKNYIQSKGLDEFIIMTGYRNDIPKILPELNLFLFTSKLEGLGTSILDAFASKIPVVATNAGGVPEMVKHEQTGLLSNIRNPIDLAMNVKRLLKEEELKINCVQNAFDSLEHFTKKAMALKTV